ncbi:MAG: hypothetical protein ABII19_01145 [Patescibacteria group bacterium]
MRKTTILVTIFSLIIWGFLPGLALGINSPREKVQPYKVDEILVKFKNQAQVEKIILDSGENVPEVILKYENRSDVEFAEPNYKMTAETIASNDPYISKQWYLDKVHVWGGW